MNNTLMNVDNINSVLSKIELSPVNSAVLSTVPDNLKEKTAAIMRANQYTSGVSLVLCAMLFNLKNDSAIKASKWKNYSNFCKEVLRLDGAQASRYATMYERLFYDVDKPIEKLATDFTVAQLVAISLLKDRAIRTLFIERVTADYSCTNINKAVAYLKDFDRRSLEDNVIDWNIVDDLLKNGKSEKLENVSHETKTTDNATAENVSHETNSTDNATAENATADNICKFTSITDFEKWKKSNKAEIVSITVVIK